MRIQSKILKYDSIIFMIFLTFNYIKKYKSIVLIFTKINKKYLISRLIIMGKSFLKSSFVFCFYILKRKVSPQHSTGIQAGFLKLSVSFSSSSPCNCHLEPSCCRMQMGPITDSKFCNRQ